MIRFRSSFLAALVAGAVVVSAPARAQEPAPTDPPAPAPVTPPTPATPPAATTSAGATNDTSSPAAPAATTDQGPPAATNAASTTTDTGNAELSQKRTPPDYDGRGGPPTTVGDVLLWGPRILLVPPYFVSEYLLRRPIGWALAGAERSGLPAALYSFFTFGEEHNAGIFPTAFIDFGFYPSVGAFAFWNDAFVKGHDLRLRGATWGKDWLAGSFASRVHIGADPLDVIAVEGRAEQRPDFTFFGLGPDTRESAQTRFGKGELEAKVYARRHYWRRSLVLGEVALKSVDFTRGGLADDPLLEDAVNDGSVPAPPGYARGYTVLQATLAGTIDSRPTGARPGSGVRFAAGATHMSELRAQGSFLRYGGSIVGFLEVKKPARVVSLGAGVRFADPLDNSDVPFTEQVTLGGDEPMRGFYENRLIDRSATVLDLGYRWPIWMWLDGTMHAEIGNVFGEHLSGFRVGRLRFSGSIGVEDTNPGDNRTQFLLGFGSETFESGGKIDSFRFLFGTTYGF